MTPCNSINRYLGFGETRCLLLHDKRNSPHNHKRSPYISGVVAQLVEAMRYNPKVAGLIPDGFIGIFIDIILPVALWP